MAIITKGKIRGKIGRVVYRVVGNKEIIQSYPRRPKKGYPEREQNTRFRAATSVASSFYRQIKDFAGHTVDSALYNSMTRYFMSYYADKPIVHNENEPALSDKWTRVHGEDRLVVTQNGLLSDFLFAQPTIDISGNEYKIQVPGFPSYRNRQGYIHPLIRETEAVELSSLLLHYDPIEEELKLINQWNSDRLIRSEAMEPTILRNDLSVDHEKELDSGFLLACFSIRLFATKASRSYLNSAKYNPVEILGVWAK